MIWLEGTPPSSSRIALLVVGRTKAMPRKNYIRCTEMEEIKMVRYEIKRKERKKVEIPEEDSIPKSIWSSDPIVSIDPIE